ncbi:MAG: OsmC family protein [Nitrospiria bacterium]
MDRTQFKALQAPLKDQYRNHPSLSKVTLSANGTLEEGRMICKVETGKKVVEAGLHQKTGGDGLAICSGDMLLEALVACAGVTLKAVATSMGLQIKDGTVKAEGDLDFAGTLGISKEIPVGFSEIRLSFELSTDENKEQLETLLKLTERYCVVYQTLRGVPKLSSFFRVIGN